MRSGHKALQTFITPLLHTNHKQIGLLTTPPAVNNRNQHHAQITPRHLQKMSSQSQTKANSTTTPPQVSEEDPTVQYVVVRRDLLTTWPTGSVLAQAVHASVAAIWASRSESRTAEYCDSTQQMRTVVLEAKDGTEVEQVGKQLTNADIRHVIWREQPEAIVTALATWPAKRSVVKRHFGKLRLFR